MVLSRGDVIKISKLANLNIAGSEEKLAGMLSETLEYIKILDELDTSNTLETYQVTNTTNVFQEKFQTGSTTLLKRDALKNAGKEIEGLFSTKQVLEK